ncbi:MAG TPA: AlkA N-terminal domain-containing protein [Vicinamibacterales bacterium]|nr:AlkA N-terminal domain-containing protein [Vicinamibacterales bacterium]
MDLDRRACDRARQSRDARFDGRFFIGVTTTRVYCRPICPARAPRDEHVRYFESAAAAEAAGFRPCLRCRPEASPGTPAWCGTSAIVTRALRLIGDGALDEAGVERLADRLGVTGRHLRRLFVQHLGATPIQAALTRRVQFAKKLIDESSLPMHDVALAAGFGSVRRFNGQMRRTYARTPSQLRRLARGRAAAPPGIHRFKLAFRPPYDWRAMLEFLRLRATPGVELVDEGHYRRTIAIPGGHGVLDVSAWPEEAALQLDVQVADPRALIAIVEGVKRMFDLGADPRVIAAHLQADRLLRRPLGRHAGLRIPGAWDAFELAVRAILGQQVSVRAATTIAGRIAAMFGAPIAGVDGLSHLFPTAAVLADAPLERAGVLPSRAASIRMLAGRVAGGTLSLGPGDPDELAAALRPLPGIGDWTIGYIAMRALGDPDALPSGDLVLRRMTGCGTAAALERRSAPWRPWRAYAALLLWHDAHERPAATPSRRTHVETVRQPRYRRAHRPHAADAGGR